MGMVEGFHSLLSLTERLPLQFSPVKIYWASAVCQALFLAPWLGFLNITIWANNAFLEGSGENGMRCVRDLRPVGRIWKNPTLLLFLLTLFRYPTRGNLKEIQNSRGPCIRSIFLDSQEGV